MYGSASCWVVSYFSVTSEYVKDVVVVVAAVVQVGYGWMHMRRGVLEISKGCGD